MVGQRPAIFSSSSMPYLQPWCTVLLLPSSPIPWRFQPRHLSSPQQILHQGRSRAGVLRQESAERHSGLSSASGLTCLKDGVCKQHARPVQEGRCGQGSHTIFRCDSQPLIGCKSLEDVQGELGKTSYVTWLQPEQLMLV